MIREYSNKDINIINILGRDLKPDYLFKLNNVGKCYIYEVEDESVGFISFDMYDDRAEIIDLVVHINHRKKGIGYELVSNAIDLCKDNGCKSITLEVRCDNKPAIELYKKCGFKIISTRKRYYDNGQVDAHLMFREL